MNRVVRVINKMNGVVRVINKNLEKLICKVMKRHQGWHEKLSYALMDYQTTIRISIGIMSYSLMYGIEAVTYRG